MKLFISYRRNDTADIAGRIADRLASHFGVASIYKDIVSIPLGHGLRHAIESEISQCDVLLAIIGQRWASEEDPSGRPRILNPDDMVRLEIETAIQAGILIVPILVSHCTFPEASHLPSSLRDLLYLHSVEIRPDPDFHRDADHLIQSIERMSAYPSPEYAKSLPAAHNFSHRDEAEPTVFVSHSSRDRRWIEAMIIGNLTERGIQTWYSKTSIRTAAQWEREILVGLQSCDWFLLIASPNSAKSEWVKDEVNWAIYHRAGKIVTVVKKRCNLWDFHIRIPRLQHIDFERNADTANGELLQAIRREGAAQAIPNLPRAKRAR